MDSISKSDAVTAGASFSKRKNPVLVDVPVNVKLFGKTADVDYGTYKLTIRSNEDNQVLGSAHLLSTVQTAFTLMEK